MPDEVEMITLTMTRKQFEALKVVATVGTEVLIGSTEEVDKALTAGAIMRLGILAGRPQVVGKMKAMGEAHKILEKAVEQLGSEPLSKEEWVK